MKAKMCPICQNIYPIFLAECPNCKYREPLNGERVLIFAITILIITILLKCLTNDVFFNVFSKEKTKFQTKEMAYSGKKTSQNVSIINIPIRPMSILSELSKNEIYERRKKYVQKSLIFS